MSALPHFSDVDLLGYNERVINLDSEIADRALDLLILLCVSARELQLRDPARPARFISFFGVPTG